MGFNKYKIHSHKSSVNKRSVEYPNLNFRVKRDYVSSQMGIYTVQKNSIRKQNFRVKAENKNRSGGITFE